MSQPLTVVETLEDFIVGWHRVGVYGGFEGRVHDAHRNGVCREGDEFVYETILDVGSASRLAVDAFMRGLEGLQRYDRLNARQVLVGWLEDE